MILFFDRTSPLSRHENPACMSMTRAMQINSHRISIVECVTGMPGSLNPSNPKPGDQCFPVPEATRKPAVRV